METLLSSVRTQTIHATASLPTSTTLQTKIAPVAYTLSSEDTQNLEVPRIGEAPVAAGFDAPVDSNTAADPDDAGGLDDDASPDVPDSGHR
ncbi:hypothetical protein E4U44_002449 [Claviceps purpurea]|nr:hypothetical protein E4U44_002449 [Claviceps purpurea]